MSIAILNSHIGPDGNLGIAIGVGRWSSTWLNHIAYGGRTDWVPSETALNSSASVDCYFDGVLVETVAIANVQTDSARCNRRVIISDSMATAGDHVCRVVTDSNDDIENDITFNVRVAGSYEHRVTGTSCYITFNRSALAGVDLGTGDSDDNAPSSGSILEPVNGHAATLSRSIIAEQSNLHVHIGDSTYPTFPEQTLTFGTPLSLTDTVTDDPVSAPRPKLDFSASITNASALRTASLANQAFYIWHENYWRAPEIQAMCRSGHQHVRIPDDNDCHNDWDWTWWTLKYGGIDAVGMSSDDGDPFTDLTIDPTADTNFDTLQQETLDFYRVFKSVWQMYAADWSPPLDGSVSAEPWVMRQASTDAVSADFVPFSWHLTTPVSEVIAKDFMTCCGMQPIAKPRFSCAYC